MTSDLYSLHIFALLSCPCPPGWARTGMRFIFPGLSGNPASCTLLPLVATEDWSISITNSCFLLPPPPFLQELLNGQDFSKFAALKPKLLEAVEDMLANDIARLMAMVRQEEAAMPSQTVKGGAFEGTMTGPFGHGYGEGASEGIDELEWVVGRDKPTYDEIFYTLSPINGKVSGAAAKKEMLKSKLPNTVLGKIWKLADVDKDGLLDDEEFALANHLIKVKLEGHELPPTLPDHLVPPSKRGTVQQD